MWASFCEVPERVSRGSCFLLELKQPSWVLLKDDGTPEMREISDPIRHGSEGEAAFPENLQVTRAPGFLKVQYTAISKLAIVVSILIFLSYQLRPAVQNPHGVDSLGSVVLGFIGSLAFCLVRFAYLIAPFADTFAGSSMLCGCRLCLDVGICPK